MKVAERRTEDAGPGFAYVYDLFEFDAGDVRYVARSYVEEPNEAHFLRKEVSGEALLIDESDTRSDLFVEAVRYLRGKGKSVIQYLSEAEEGYVSVAP